MPDKMTEGLAVHFAVLVSDRLAVLVLDGLAVFAFEGLSLLAADGLAMFAFEGVALLAADGLAVFAFEGLALLQSWTKLLRKLPSWGSFFLNFVADPFFPPPLPLEAVLLGLQKKAGSLSICRKQL